MLALRDYAGYIVYQNKMALDLKIIRLLDFPNLGVSFVCLMIQFHLSFFAIVVFFMAGGYEQWYYSKIWVTKLIAL